MSDIGDSTELAAELAMEAVDEPERRRWHSAVAFTTLVIAVLAATAALLAGMTAEEVFIDRTEQIIDIAIAQGDLERAQTLRAKHELLLAVGRTPDPAEIALVQELEAGARAELDEAAEARNEVRAVGSIPLVFAVAATVFAVAIAVSGLSVIVDRKWLWAVGSVIALGGVVALVVGVVGLGA